MTLHVPLLHVVATRCRSTIIVHVLLSDIRYPVELVQ